MSDKSSLYALGIDGGGSKTAFTLVDGDGNVKQSFVLGGSSFDTYSLADIKAVFKTAKERLLFAPKAIFAGIGGIIGEEKKAICVSLLKEIFPDSFCFSDNDCVNALYAMEGKGEGIILIAGTGSVAYGEYKNKSARSGGYCYQEGDLGSSYDVGKKALQYFAKAMDGRADKSSLFEAMKEELGFADQVRFASYMEKANRKEIASFAKIVTNNEIDIVAERILIEAAEECYSMVEAVYRRLEIDVALPFGIIGGLGKAESKYRKHLLTKIETNLPHLKLYEGEMDAGLGSAYKAKEILWNGLSPR